MVVSVEIEGKIYEIASQQQRHTLLRTDMMLVTLFYGGGESLIFEKVEGGGRGEALTLYRLRRSDDSAAIVHLLNAEEPVEVVCQPMNSRRELVGAALVYQGLMSTVRPDILDANRADAAYLTVSLDEWDVRRREQGDE